MRRLRIVLVAGLLVAQSVGPVYAVQPDEILPDAALETKARKISAELRCLVCQNQSIDDSDAPLARDLRLLVRERLKAGDGERETLDYIVARYGEFVLLRPPFKMSTVLLWVTPLFALAAALLLARGSMTQNAEPAATARLSDDEEKRLKSVVDRNDA